MIAALASGAFLGLSCGLAPGPLLALLLAQTLRHGPREGCKIALTPLVTDAPIIVVALVVAASRLSGPPGGRPHQRTSTPSGRRHPRKLSSWSGGGDSTWSSAISFGLRAAACSVHPTFVAACRSRWLHGCLRSEGTNAR